ncbi:RNA-binding domain-containing protein [Lentzea sp. CC55]|uniref:RNA-binding domain-containing protein n=1 Tax=Lentzea sp. CC55 TaxID=2884909 RepID=UPI001F3E70E2|nr:RNA-binding domain-containing protein [Lentzea sp. CC55]MCG8926990.1 putative DNA binding domain-containing protein [Lentzea sp. CC55]
MNLAVLERMVRQADLSLDALKYFINCRGECEWLDFKEFLTLENDSETAAFTKDVLAMKNAGGGYIVVGVQDKTWVPVGLPEQLPYDGKMLRDKIRKASGLDLAVDIVQHTLRYPGESRWFAIIYVRSTRKRTKRRAPSLVKNDFRPKEKYGLRRGEIYFRRGDSTVRLDDYQELEDLLEELEYRSDHSTVVNESTHSVFAVNEGFYRLLEPDYRLFVGRETLRQKLVKAILENPRIWIINVHGPGGVGKSALVTWAVYDFYQKRTFESILQLTAKETVLSATGIARTTSRTLYSLEDLLDQILNLYGESCPDDLEKKRELATQWLSLEPTLIVLDNLETVDDGRILSFVQNLPETCLAKFVITSRRRTGGWELPVTVPELDEEETRELAKTKASELGLELNIDGKTLRELTSATGGLPLAIQWTLGQYKLCGSLKQALNAVRGSDSPVLEFTFRNIWDVLSSDARRLLAVMSIFESPPTEQLLLCAMDISADRLADALVELQEATLLTKQINPTDGQSVYVALPITLSFSMSRLPQFGPLELESRTRLQKYMERMEMQSWEVAGFDRTFDRFGVASETEKRGVILCRRGESETFAGNFDVAADLFNQARDMAPTSAYVYAMSASFELARQRIGQALKFADIACTRATKLTGALAYTVKARVSNANKDKIGRISALRRALDYAPDDVVLRHQLGVALSHAGKSHEAVAEFTKIIEIESQRSTPTETLIMALKTRVINYRRMGWTEEADTDLRMANNLIAQHSHLASQADHIAELQNPSIF